MISQAEITDKLIDKRRNIPWAKVTNEQNGAKFLVEPTAYAVPKKRPKRNDKERKIDD